MDEEPGTTPPKLTVRAKVNGRSGTALVDSGCTQMLVWKGWAKPRPGAEKMWIRCIHGDVKGYPAGEAKVEVAGQEQWMEVGIAVPPV